MFTTRRSPAEIREALGRARIPKPGLPVGSVERSPNELLGRGEQPADESGGPTGWIVIRLGEGADRPEVDEARTLVEAAERLDQLTLLKVLDAFDLGEGRRLLQKVEPSVVREMEARARQSDFPPMRSLLSYWMVDARERFEQLDEIVKRLRATPGVADAYPHGSGAEPAINPANDTYNGQQGYLDAAPTGIDARWAWDQPDGCGAGIAVIDVERGWTLTHEDFAAKAPTVIIGDNRAGSANHGTAVLGEMIADDNTVGVVGIAPLAGPVNAASHWDESLNQSGFIAEAIAVCLQNLSPGDVVILEIQTTSPSPFGAPVELVDDTFDAVRLASALGIIVFEAAGNGDNDLDTITNMAGLQVLDPTSADFRDSGAIICGAATSTVPHDRMNFSSFGARVDCYAWGEDVVTTGYGDLDMGSGSDEWYTDDFGGTSSATPIVTGAGLVVQGMHEAATGARLSPSQMRVILTNPATGTAQGAGVAGAIGVMPDLRAILEDDLGLAPDVYLRDHTSDDGTVPTSGGVSSSPDIIVRPVAVADPTVAFGEGSGTENSNSLGFEVEAGQDNFIYARMRNRGGSTANGVTARVFWSEVSTLVTPAMWNEIGVTPPVNVSVGDTLVVTDPVTWPSSEVPGEGHYCFVGILDHVADPAPVLPSPTDFAGFVAFIRGQNNVAWRNFNVVDDLDDPEAEPSIQDFLIANYPDARRRFDFVIERRMPREVKVLLELPLQIAKPFCAGLDVDCEIDRELGVARVGLPATGRLVVPGVLLGADARLKCRFILEGKSKYAQPGNMLSIGQFVEDQEVGRVTWRYLRKRDPNDVCVPID